MNESIETVAELIEALKKYPLNTEVRYLTGTKDTSKFSSNLFLVEANGFGDRDAEDMLVLEFANTPNPRD